MTRDTQRVLLLFEPPTPEEMDRESTALTESDPLIAFDTAWARTVFDLALDVVGRLFLDAGDMNYAQRDITADCLVDRPLNRIGGSLRAVHADDHCGG